MSQANEAQAAVEIEEQQQPEPQSLMEAARNEVSHETNDEADQNQSIPHMDNGEDKDEESYERPEWFPEKFWAKDGPDLEKMANSYTGLEKKLSQNTKAPETYELGVLTEAGLDTSDPIVDYYQGWAKENGVSQDAFNDLASKFIDGQVLSTQETQQSIEAEKKILGANADEIIKSNLVWADSLLDKGSISKEEHEEIDVWGGTAAGARLLQKVRAMTGENVSIPLVTEHQNTVSEDEFREDVQKLMSDPRYGVDAAYTRGVENKFKERFR